MSKIRIGDRVQIKSAGSWLEGIVLDRIVNIYPETNRCEKLWLVKPDNAKSFADYKTCTRKDIGKLGGHEYVRPMSIKEKITTPFGAFTLMLVGHIIDGPRFEYLKSKDDFGTCSSATYDPSVKKTLKIGWAICNPNDEWDWDKGLKIAVHRAKTRPFSVMYTTNNGEFDNKTIIAILESKVDYFREHWRRFITVPEVKEG